MPILLKPFDPCKTCIGWSWSPVGAGFVPPDGTGSNGVLLVFEAAGEHEAKEGRPLMGPAGFQFVKMLQRGGMRREDFRIANTISCRPPDNFLRGASYEEAVIAHCSPLLDQEIATFKPRCIVAGGDVALKRLLSLDRGITITDARGYVFWSDRYRTWVIPTLHPSYIMRGKTTLTSVFIHDLQRSVEIASEGFEAVKPAYTLDPTHDVLESWIRDFNAYYEAHPDLRLSEDIETPMKGQNEDELDLDDPTYTLLRVGFAYRPKEALSVPFQAQFIPAIKYLTGHPSQKIWWNGAYDQPRLISNGMALGGVQHDAMVAWHLLHSDLPKGLGFVATFCCPDQPMWKHLFSQEPAFYNATDADVALRNMITTEAELKKASLWGLYDKHVLQLNPIRSEMSAAGMPINPVTRLKSALRLDGLMKTCRAAMQDVVPLSARHLDPPKGYVRPPADVSGMTTIKVKTFVARCDRCGMVNPPKPHFKEFVKKSNPCSGAKKILVEEEVERFTRVLEFIPSTVQILTYQKVMKHQTIMTGRGKDRRATTDEKALNALVGKYPNDRLYPLVLEFRELQTLQSRYIGYIEVVDGVEKIIGGMSMDKNNLVHTIFKDDPSTWRMSSASPNLQNIPRGNDSEIQHLVKEMFEAPEGWVIGSRDYSGIEARLVGWFAHAKAYYRLAGLGVHDFFNAHRLYELDKKIALADVPDLSWSDADLKEAFKVLKARFPIERDESKRVVHLSNYKGTPLKMHQEYPKVFKTTRDASKLQKFYFDLFPEIPKWHETLCRQVDKTSFIRSPFGYIHRFYRVLEHEKGPEGWTWTFGDDAKRLIAFLPQNTASGILKESAITIAHEYPECRSSLRLFIHDDITWLCNKNFNDHMLEVTKAVMEASMTCLPLDPDWGMGEFVTVGTAAKVGTTWGNQEDL